MNMISPKFGRKNSGPAAGKPIAGKKTGFTMFGGFLGNQSKTKHEADVELIQTQNRDRTASAVLPEETKNNIESLVGDMSRAMTMVCQMESDTS